MNSNMQIQLVLFAIAVSVCVAWTRLLYYDGLHRQLSRLKRHCLIHAGMIISISGWAVSIGIYVQASAMSVIQEQRATINNLARGAEFSGKNRGVAHQIANMDYGKDREERSQPIEVKTPGGITVSFTGYSTTTGDDTLLSGSAGHDKRRRTSRYLGSSASELNGTVFELHGGTRGFQRSF